jgi:hypothetical protein
VGLARHHHEPVPVHRAVRTASSRWISCVARSNPAPLPNTHLRRVSLSGGDDGHATLPVAGSSAPHPSRRGGAEQRRDRRARSSGPGGARLAQSTGWNELIGFGGSERVSSTTPGLAAEGGQRRDRAGAVVPVVAGRDPGGERVVVGGAASPQAALYGPPGSPAPALRADATITTPASDTPARARLHRAPGPVVLGEVAPPALTAVAPPLSAQFRSSASPGSRPPQRRRRS